jgi:membrane protein DedA with SNARE-associated domain
MSIFQLILPYLALCGGILLEGESFLLAAAISAHYGIMNIYLIILLTIICTQASDWFWFFTGRKKGSALIQKRPAIQKRIEFFYSFIDKYPYQVMFFYRFVYGFRSVMPLILGTSRVKARHFLIFGLSSTIVWSSTFAFLGFYFGSFIQSHIQLLKKYQYYIIIPFLVAGIIFLIRHIIRKNSANISENAPTGKRQFGFIIRLSNLKTGFQAKARF